MRVRAKVSESESESESKSESEGESESESESESGNEPSRKKIKRGGKKTRNKVKKNKRESNKKKANKKRRKTRSERRKRRKSRRHKKKKRNKTKRIINGGNNHKPVDLERILDFQRRQLITLLNSYDDINETRIETFPFPKTIFNYNYSNNRYQITLTYWGDNSFSTEINPNTSRNGEIIEAFKELIGHDNNVRIKNYLINIF